MLAHQRGGAVGDTKEKRAFLLCFALFFVPLQPQTEPNNKSVNHNRKDVSSIQASWLARTSYVWYEVDE